MIETNVLQHNSNYNVYNNTIFTSRALVNNVTIVLFMIIGVEIGTLPNEQHQISGTLQVLDSNTLYIEDFNYDGGGPGEEDIITSLCMV